MKTTINNVQQSDIFSLLDKNYESEKNNLKNFFNKVTKKNGVN